MRMQCEKTAIIALIALGGAVCGPTVYGQASQPTPGHLVIEQVKPGLYAILNPGGNTIAARVTNEGVILVDDMPAMYYGQIVERIKSVTNQPIRYIINTHHHNDHSGSNAQFRAADKQIIFVAHDNVRHNMTCGKTSNPDPSAAPNLTYAQQATIRLGDAEVRLYHFGRGHTNGDTVAYFPDLKVAVTGDLFTAYLNPPRIEAACGGSSYDWLQTMDKVLALDIDRVIPGHGPVSTKQDIANKRHGMEMLQARTIDLIRKGVLKDQYKNELHVDDLGWTLGAAFSGDGWSSFWDEMAASIGK